MQETTSLSLLDRLGDNPDSEDWERLVVIYRPLLLRWLRSYEVQPADAEDLTQEVLSVVTNELPSFEHNQQAGAFRNWLRRILVHRLRNFWRSRNYTPQARGSSSLVEQLNQLEDDTSGLSRVWNAEHDQHVLARLMELVRPRFEPQTWEAFRRQVFDAERADRVAADMQLSLSSVYTARSRVLAALRRESAGLIDSF